MSLHASKAPSQEKDAYCGIPLHRNVAIRSGKTTLQFSWDSLALNGLPMPRCTIEIVSATRIIAVSFGLVD
jgi:hypothetical protein